MRFPSLLRAAGLAVAVASAAALTACAGNGSQSTPSAVSPASATHVVATQAVAGGFSNSLSRNRTIAGPAFLRGPGGDARTAAGTVVYDSIVTVGKGLSSHIASEGYECCSVNEFGDGLVLSQTGRLKQIEVVLDSWACQQGGVYEDTCVSAKGAKFQWPLTANVYSVTGYPSGVPTVGTLLATHTQTFNISYRPSANNKVCQGPHLGEFLGPVDKQFDHGLATPVTFNMNVPIVQLPQQVIVTIVYNTSDYGPNPAGHNTACFQAGNCPYDSLNVSAWGNGGVDDGIGSVIDSNGAFVNYQNAGFYCSPNPYGQPTGGYLTLDTLYASNGDCWNGYHPEIKVTTF